MSGYARAWRSRWEHPLFKTKQEAAVWAWMCDSARFRAHSFQTRFGMVHLDRGQLLISERGIAEDFGLHKNTVRRLISTMQDHGMISLKRDHEASRAGTIATIVKYEQYQTDVADEDAPQDQDGTKTGTVTGPRRDHNGTTREERIKRKEREEEKDSSISASAGAGLPVMAAPASDVVEAFERYQAMRAEIVPHGRPITLTEPRRKALAGRLKECGGLAGWDHALAQIRGSPFLRGETSRNGFVAEIDWLLKPANLTKVLEGNYDDRKSSNGGAGGQRSSVPMSTIDALRVARNAAGLG